MVFTGWRYWTLVVGGALAIALVVADFVFSQMNITAQAEINQRQQLINQGIELNRVEQTLIRTIAVAATRNKDTQLIQVLAEQGITISVTPPATASNGSGNSSGPTAPPSPTRGNQR